MELFDVTFQTLDRNDAKLTPGDWTISDTVSTYWTNFAKTGGSSVGAS